MNNVIRIFLLVFGNASALLLALLALETTVTNLVGWFLFATGIAYGAGGAISLWRDQILDKQACPETGHRSSWWLLPGFLASFFIPPVEFLYLPAILPRGSGMELGGLMLILLGLSLLVWRRRTACGKDSGRLHTMVGQALVTGGPYRWVRHPGYSGFLLVALGMALGYSSLIGLIAIPLLLLPGLAYRIKVEEDRLSDQFRDDYRAYARRSKKLIPGIW